MNQLSLPLFEPRPAPDACQSVANALQRHRVQGKSPMQRPLRPEAVVNDFRTDGAMIAAAGRALAADVMSRLEELPIRTLANGAQGVTIRLLDALDYVVDSRHRRVYVQLTCPVQQRLFAPWCWLLPADHYGPLTHVEVLAPLCRPMWLHEVFRQGLWLRQAEPRLARMIEDELPEHGARAFTCKVTAWAHKALWREPAFHSLRARLTMAIQAAVGPEVMLLALRARLVRRSESLQNGHLNFVWQHQALFEEVQRENPRLLRTATAWMRTRNDPFLRGLRHVLPAMRADLLAHGLPPKAWRYLVQYGIEHLVSERDRAPWARLTDSLQTLRHAGWPPAPPLRLLPILLNVVGNTSPEPGSTDVAVAWLWNTVCRRAAEVRADTKAYAALCDALPVWAWVLRDTGRFPDRNQQRHGIPWLVRTAAALQPLREQAGPGWSPWVKEIRWPVLNDLQVVPLTDRRLLLEEAIAMKNCADAYEQRCRQGWYLLLSLRHTRTGKRDALAGLQRHGKVWRFDNVLGPCNQPVNEPVRYFAQHLADVLNEHLVAAA